MGILCYHSIPIMYKIPFSLLYLVHLFSCLLSPVYLLSSDQFCGPQECGLLCEGGESCVQDDQVNCCCEPCCAQWSCVSVPPVPSVKCPDIRPQFNSPCTDAEEGLHCDYGSQECCGEQYPEISMECSYNEWSGYYVDTLCILGLAPPCPDDTTTTTEPLGYDETTTGISSCPAQWPDESSPCVSGLYCPYGMEECCGEMVPDVIFECVEGTWSVIIIDSLCDFGLPCPDDDTTVRTF